VEFAANEVVDYKCVYICTTHIGADVESSILTHIPQHVVGRVCRARRARAMAVHEKVFGEQPCPRVPIGVIHDREIVVGICIDCVARHTDS
jgi:hypothetical protein